MGGELGIRRGEFWAFRQGKSYPLQRVVVLEPGMYYDSDIRIRLMDDPVQPEYWVRRVKLPCKWDDREAYLDAHPDVPRDYGPPPDAVPENPIVVQAKALRALIHEEVASAVGIKKLAYTYDEASVATGYSVGTLRAAVNDGALMPSYANTRPVFREEELRRWLEELPAAPR